MKRFVVALAAISLWAVAAAAEAGAPIEVMIVGTYHMSNPGRDLHDVRADDVLTPKRQTEIAGLVDSIARFRPTVVDVEGEEPTTAQKYAQYVKGSLAPSRNEVVQLGFRLAKQAGASVHGIDVEGDFPYDAVQAYAKTHGEQPLLDQVNAETQSDVDRMTGMLRQHSIADVLRYMNDPASVRHGQNFYRLMLNVGGGASQPGADLLAAWYKRNFYICANLVQLAKPGDRVVVFYGAGHAFLLRQCVSEMPGYRLIEANDYLPKR